MASISAKTILHPASSAPALMVGNPLAKTIEQKAILPKWENNFLPSIPILGQPDK
jgi:hypothetical protein